MRCTRASGHGQLSCISCSQGLRGTIARPINRLSFETYVSMCRPVRSFAGRFRIGGIVLLPRHAA